MNATSKNPFSPARTSNRNLRIQAFVLEHLRAIRGSVERTEYDVKDLKFRVGQIEQSHHSLRFDRLEKPSGPH